MIARTAITMVQKTPTIVSPLLEETSIIEERNNIEDGTVIIIIIQL